MAMRPRSGPWYDAFAQRLRSAMEAVGLRQRDLARELHVNEGTVSRWLDGAVPEPELIPRLAETLEVSIDYLFGVAAPQPAQGARARRTTAATTPGPPSLVRSRLELLDSNEVMFLRLDPPNRKRRRAPTIARGTILMVDELLDSGDTHVVVGRVMTPAGAHEEDDVGHSQERGGSRPAPLGRQHAGKPRGFRRQPTLSGAQTLNEDDDRDPPWLLTREEL